MLSQKQPIPENYLLGAPKVVFQNPFGQGSFDQEILDEYVSTFRNPAQVYGICEEDRAAATIDVEHDHLGKEASKSITCPMLHLWSEGACSTHSIPKKEVRSVFGGNGLHRHKDRQ